MQIKRERKTEAKGCIPTSKTRKPISSHRRFEELWNRKSQLYLALCGHVLKAEFIPNKEATIIAESILRIGISQPGLGPMDYLHSDHGGEFLKDTLISEQVGPTPESNSILKCILSPKRF